MVSVGIGNFCLKLKCVFCFILKPIELFPGIIIIFDTLFLLPLPHILSLFTPISPLPSTTICLAFSPLSLSLSLLSSPHLFSPLPPPYTYLLLPSSLSLPPSLPNSMQTSHTAMPVTRLCLVLRGSDMARWSQGRWSLREHHLPGGTLYPSKERDKGCCVTVMYKFDDAFVCTWDHCSI